MDRYTLRDWGHRSNAEGITALSSRRHGGSERKLSAAHEEESLCGHASALTAERDDSVRWQLIDLRERNAREFDVHLHECSVGKVNFPGRPVEEA